MREIFLSLNSWIVSIFHKEALLIFVIYCLMTFLMALLTVVWALRTGQFKDIESSKYEILEESL